MYLLKVIPISKSRGVDELSYFSTLPADHGDIVEVPLRSKNVKALVIQSESVVDAKSVIRRAGYALKKIVGMPKPGIISSEVVEAGLDLAREHAAKPGAVFSTLLPKELFDLFVPQKKSVENIHEPYEPRLASQKIVLQASFSDRVDQYRLLVREEFARGKSVMIAASTQIECEVLFESLKRGIEAYTILLHSRLPKKALTEGMNRGIAEAHPLLFITTPSFLSFPRDDVALIILERENAESWRGVIAPFLDYRVFAESLAEKRGSRFLLAGEPLRVATIVRQDEGILEELFPVSRRRTKGCQIEIMDAKADAKKADADGRRAPAFTCITSALYQEINLAIESRQHIVLLASRRGLAPITVCGDCGEPVICQFSNTPMVLAKGNSGNVFICRACGETRSAKETCKNCGSWKLVPLGVGIERVEDELSKYFPKVPLMVMERERIPSQASAKKVISNFFASQNGAILLGTELMLSYLPAALPLKAPLGAIVSMDALLSLPEWNAYERAYATIVRLGESVSEKMFIQSRLQHNPLLDAAVKDDLLSFYQSEIEARKVLGYPPFSILIKISVEGTNVAVEKEIEQIEQYLAPTPLLGVNRPLHLGHSKYRINGFIRLPRSLWPNNELIQKLAAIPPHISVIVDPSSIL